MVRDDLDPVADAIVHSGSFGYLEGAVFVGEPVQKELRMRLDSAVSLRARDSFRLDVIGQRFRSRVEDNTRRGRPADDGRENRLRAMLVGSKHLRLIRECPCDVKDLMLCSGSRVLEDFKGRKLIAFGGEWSVGFLTKHNEGLILDDWLSV